MRTTLVLPTCELYSHKLYEGASDGATSYPRVRSRRRGIVCIEKKAEERRRTRVPENLLHARLIYLYVQRRRKTHV